MVILPDGLQPLLELLDPKEQYYIVGGAVRDLLLSRSNHDLDIVCSGDTRTIARNLAQKTSGAFYMLDEERNACRVIITSSDGNRLLFDLTQMRGQSILEDLADRDFTINAMAVDLSNRTQIIDPLKGARDLQEKRLRPCSNASFLNDPLRIVRAIRYSVGHDLKIEPATIELIKAAIPGLSFISQERKRDELFKILSNPKPWVAIDLILHFKILEQLGLPAILDPRAVILCIRQYAAFCSYILGDLQNRDADALLISSFINEMKPFRSYMKDHLQKNNQSDRSRIGLNGLALLLFESGSLGADQIGKNLALSNDEIMHLRVLLEKRETFNDLAQQSQPIEPRLIFRYFRELGEFGIDLGLISLVRTASGISAELDDKSWLKRVSLFRQLVNSWFLHPEIVCPKPLLSGVNLMFEFDLAQGPLIGVLLEGLREEQASGNILDRQSALEWVDMKLYQDEIRKD